MKARTVSAIQTEAAYLRHRIERVYTDAGEVVMGSEEDHAAYSSVCALRAALARTEAELGPQGQVSIEGIEGAVEFRLL